MARQLAPQSRRTAELAAEEEPSLGADGPPGRAGPLGTGRPARTAPAEATRETLQSWRRGASTRDLPRMRRNGCPSSILQRESDKQGQRDLGQGHSPESQKTDWA